MISDQRLAASLFVKFNKLSGGSMKMKIIVWFIVLIAVAVAGFAGYVWIALHWSYSSGERAGYVQKFSRKGWVCKTWEGELTMMPVAGSIPEKFIFSVRDNRVAGSINASMGKKVKIYYEQHKWVPTSCFGETEYYVSEVKALE
jgi:hypothetical protein